MSRIPSTSVTLSKALTVTALVAIAIWMGGMLALGAIVAPVIFHEVPAPTSADAMTIVFRRFDRIAMACAVVVLLVEVALAAIRKPITKRDLTRGGAAVIACALAIWEGVGLAPKIEQLHRAGAIRGLGSLGGELQEAHRLAVLCGNALSLLLVLIIALHVFAAREAPSAAP